MFNKASSIQEEKIDAGKAKIQENRGNWLFLPSEENQPGNGRTGYEQRRSGDTAETIL